MNPQREPRLAEVAERAGVSVTTVSRVLNNRGYLSQQTKDKVAQAIDELNYHPNQVARSLLGHRTNTIGLVLPTVALPFYGEVAVEVENALAEHQCQLLLCNSFGRSDRERAVLDMLVANRVDGIILGAHNDPVDDYSRLRQPVVTIDRELAPHIPNVRAQNETGGRLATELLLKRGARRPALVTSRSHSRNLRERGYRDVLAAAGIDPTVVTVDFHLPEAERARTMEAKLDALTPQADAVFATDDLLAAGVLDWTRRRGLEVPGQFKVVGFDGTLAATSASGLPTGCSLSIVPPRVIRTGIDAASPCPKPAPTACCACSWRTTARWTSSSWPTVWSVSRCAAIWRRMRRGSPWSRRAHCAWSPVVCCRWTEVLTTRRGWSPSDRRVR